MGLRTLLRALRTHFQRVAHSMVALRVLRRVALVVAAVTSGAAILVSLFTLSAQLRQSNQHLEIHLVRELTREFFDRSSESSVYRPVRVAIEACAPLYVSWGGAFDHDELNAYLGFFEELGFFHRKRVLTLDTIDHAFGAYIVEAYEHDQVRRFIRGLRDNAKQIDSFNDFEALASELAAGPRREEATMMRAACSSKPAAGSVEKKRPGGCPEGPPCPGPGRRRRGVPDPAKTTEQETPRRR